jgi:hypothetical protein
MRQFFKQAEDLFFSLASLENAEAGSSSQGSLE